jgi:hypothetical protein
MIALVVGCSATAIGCASMTIAREGGLVITGHVYDDPTLAGKVALDTEDVPPTQLGTPVPACDVQVARRPAGVGGASGAPAADRTDVDGRFNVFAGEQPGPYEMVLAVECPGYETVEHVFMHRGPRSYRAAVFVTRAP